MSTSPQFAFVTLVTTDEYLPGALVVAAALRDIHPTPSTSPEELDPTEFHIVCLVTPESVNVGTMKLLRRAFDVVVGVELIEEETKEGLKLLGRLDLKTVLTKLHVFRLTSYRKIIFLDADALPLRPLSHLFRISADFAAVPDIGWPDIFNSGFLVLTPGVEKFDEIMSLVKTKGSWDGGDQGVLNEWRGKEWERLSFTYNTMPTAVYTYAPAYKRFGSQISNVHFIGPNKPWAQIPLRPPGSSSFQALSPAAKTPPPSYAFSALLDRWFAVYDRHYRSPSSSLVFGNVAASSEPAGKFITQRYDSAWDSGMQGEAGVSATSGPLSLEELRRLAVEGIGDSSTTEGEGVYRSLPLEGRIDLMRPSKPALATSEEAVLAVTDSPSQPVVRIQSPSDPQTPIRSHSPAPMTTLPTPGPNELPPAPMIRGHSLPPETPTHAPRTQTHPRSESPSRPTSPPHPHRRPSPMHPASPPLISWNPAIEAPPSIPPPVSHFPEETYFPNAWDAPAQVSHTPAEGGGLFPLHPPSNIPEQLVREGHYKAIIGEAGHQDQQQDTPSQEERQNSQQPHQDMPPPHPQPDRSKIMSVFPWEEQPRLAPQRFYPRTDSPPPGHPFIQAKPPALRLDLHLPQTFPPASPPAPDFPRATKYDNAWDAVPSIQRYAARLVRPSLPASSVGAEQTGKGSPTTAPGDEYRRWRDRAEVSSRDADDEDEGDDEDGHPSPPSIGAESDRSNGLSEPPSRKYKAKGIQTLLREVKHQSVQVPNGAPTAPGNVLSSQDRDTGKEKQLEKIPPHELGRELTSNINLFEQMAGATPAVNAPGFMLPQGLQPPVKPHQQSFEAHHHPSGALSPRLHDPNYNTGLTISQEKASAMPELSPDPPIPLAGTASVSKYIASPPSPLEPSSPPEGTSQARESSPTVLRPAGRTFDPARGVDIFKKDSEDVLTRFIKMGSWDGGILPSQSPASAV